MKEFEDYYLVKNKIISPGQYMEKYLNDYKEFNNKICQHFYINKEKSYEQEYLNKYPKWVDNYVCNDPPIFPDGSGTPGEVLALDLMIRIDKLIEESESLTASIASINSVNDEIAIIAKEIAMEPSPDRMRARAHRIMELLEGIDKDGE